jgi:hypothetical protein
MGGSTQRERVVHRRFLGCRNRRVSLNRWRTLQSIRVNAGDHVEVGLSTENGRIGERESACRQRAGDVAVWASAGLGAVHLVALHIRGRARIPRDVCRVSNRRRRRRRWHHLHRVRAGREVAPCTPSQKRQHYERKYPSYLNILQLEHSSLPHSLTLAWPLFLRIPPAYRNLPSIMNPWRVDASFSLGEVEISQVRLSLQRRTTHLHCKTHNSGSLPRPNTTRPW